MEPNEMEISKLELQCLVRDRVQKILLSSSALNAKFNLLRSLLSRKWRQINKLSTICQSVAKCEKTVKELYSLLGWEYEDQDCDEGDAEPAGCSRARPFLFVPSGHHIHKALRFQPPSPQSSTSEDEEMQERYDDCERPVILKKNAVVVLTKLSSSQIPALRSPSPQTNSSEEEVLNSPESDVQWEPETDFSDSELSGSDFDTRPNKKRRINQMDRMWTRNSQTSRRSRSVDSISGSLTPTSTPETSSTESDGMELSPVEASPEAEVKTNTAEATALQANRTKTTKSEKRKRMESDNRQRMESDKRQRTESDKRQRTESDIRQRTESDKRQRTESDKRQRTKSDKRQRTESVKRQRTESDKRQRTESDKRKRTESDNRKTMESDKPKTKSNTSQTTPQANTTTSQTNTTNSTPHSNTKTTPQLNSNKTSTLSAEINGEAPATSQSQTATSTPKMLQVELTVNLDILARRRTLCWKPGKITEIITKGNGKVKYKVVFEEQGKCLVSSHHIALNSLPQLEYLSVGARVLVKCEGDQSDFKPGILAEVPSRRNRMRFLVFIDDHTPVYCALPSLHLVCKPLADPLDDIPDENHRSFMREYLKAWPYPLVTQYKLGQMVNVEYKGVQQKGEVLMIDCSLIQVVFTCDQHKEWIFRGSMRLEHMINVKKDMLAKMNGEKKNWRS